MENDLKVAEQIAAFPDALRELISAELGAGNRIVEISSTFPAPPAGAYVKLENQVSTRPRETGGGVNFYDRNSSSYSGEFTDAKRFYFVLEPPHPPEEPPTMDQIRAEMEARYQAADAARIAASLQSEAVTDEAGGAVTRFRASMEIDYEKWHEGIGYDITGLQGATAEERQSIARLLLGRPVADWRDVEALAALESLGVHGARAGLRTALQGSDGSDHSVRIAVLQYAPGLVSEEERNAVLVAALEEADTYGGLTQALLLVEEHHPSEIIDALMRGVLRRRDGAPVHFAAMLLFLHGRAGSAFDWEQRPFFLQFLTEDRGERAMLFRELCARIGVDGERFLEEARQG